MKRIFLFIIFVFYYSSSYSQTIKASLGIGSQANRIKLYLKPSGTKTLAYFSTLQFNVGIDTSIKPKPTISVTSTTFSGVNWVVTESIEGGYYNYQITTSTSPLQVNTTANIEFEVMELMISNGPSSLNKVSLVTLPDGGKSAFGNGLFLSTGYFSSIGSLLYYTRTGVTTSNKNSYDATGVMMGVDTSYATLNGIAFAKPSENIIVKSTMEDNFSDFSKNIFVYPNPSKDVFYVQCARKDQIDIRVIDLNGRTAYRAKGIPGQKLKFGEQLMSGIYFVEISHGNEVKTVKALKIN